MNEAQIRLYLALGRRWTTRDGDAAFIETTQPRSLVTLQASGERCFSNRYRERMWWEADDAEIESVAFYDAPRCGSLLLIGENAGMRFIRRGQEMVWEPGKLTYRVGRRTYERREPSPAAGWWARIFGGV